MDGETLTTKATKIWDYLGEGEAADEEFLHLLCMRGELRNTKWQPGREGKAKGSRRRKEIQLFSQKKVGKSIKKGFEDHWEERLNRN